MPNWGGGLELKDTGEELSRFLKMGGIVLGHSLLIIK